MATTPAPVAPVAAASPAPTAESFAAAAPSSAPAAPPAQAHGQAESIFTRMGHGLESALHGHHSSVPEASQPTSLASSAASTSSTTAVQPVTTAAQTAAPAPAKHNAVVTVVDDIGDWFKRVFKSATWANTASAALTVIAPLVETIVALIEPAMSAEVAGIISQVQTDMGVAASLIKQSQATPTLTGTLQSIQQNLNSILTALDIKNPTTLAQVESVVNTIVQEIEAIVAIVPATSSTAAV